MVYVLKFGSKLFTANIRQYDCLCVRLCVYVTERESEILYFDLILYNCTLNFQNYLLYSSVCRLLWDLLVANHIVCKCEQLISSILTHMSLLSLSAFRILILRANILTLFPQSRLLSLSMTCLLYIFINALIRVRYLIFLVC